MFFGKPTLEKDLMDFSVISSRIYSQEWWLMSLQKGLQFYKLQLTLGFSREFAVISKSNMSLLRDR